MKNNRVIFISAALLVVAAFIAVLIVSCKNGESEGQTEKKQNKADISSAFSVVSDPMLTMGIGEVCAYPQQSGASYSCDRTVVLTVDAQYFSIREADDQFFIDDYSQFFNWDKEKNPAIEVSTSN